MNLKRLILSTTAILLLASCSNSTKKTLGVTEEMPDELQVKKAKPLEVPPHFHGSKATLAPEKKIDAKKKTVTTPLSDAEKAIVKEVEEKN